MSTGQFIHLSFYLLPCIGITTIEAEEADSSTQTLTFLPVISSTFLAIVDSSPHYIHLPSFSGIWQQVHMFQKVWYTALKMTPVCRNHFRC